MVRLSFHGAARTVTGSKYLLEVDDHRVLIDCGLFQGLKQLRLKNWEPSPFEPSSVDCVVLTHAHLDHIGYLPRLRNEGFAGPVYCTRSTEELSELILYDAAKNQEYDAQYANRKGFSKHHPALPLFDSGDVTRVMKQFRSLDRDRWQQASGPVWFRYHTVGHLLGASMIEVEIRGGERPLRLLFSGDVGRYDAPLYHDPLPPPACDYLICESTYGNRDHPRRDVLDVLADEVHASIERGGVMLIASFAVGRAQQLIYLLEVLIRQERIPELPIYLDSPMAIEATEIHRAYENEHSLKVDADNDWIEALTARNVHLVRGVDESKRLNDVQGPAVIISSSGMMIGGRILHHLRQRLPNERNTILLGGFMAAGTRGRALQDGAKRLRMHGMDVPVRAAVVELSGLSGHADRSELLRWLEPLAPPRRVFLTHGEQESAEAFAKLLAERRGWETYVPRLGETVELEAIS